MAVIKVFDSVGVKTVQLMGNLEEQSYDEEEVDPNYFAEEEVDPNYFAEEEVDPNYFAEETDDGF